MRHGCAARIPCLKWFRYHDGMPEKKHSLTITVDAETLKQARVYAARHDTSVNDLLRDYLQDLASQEGRNKDALRQLVEVMSAGIPGLRPEPVKRDDLYAERLNLSVR